MSAPLEIEVIEEWNYYDGFREGILRIKRDGAFSPAGDLYHAWATEYRVQADDETRIEARSLFHQLSEALGLDISTVAPDPGPLHFTYAQFYAAVGRRSATSVDEL